MNAFAIVQGEHEESKSSRRYSKKHVEEQKDEKEATYPFIHVCSSEIDGTFSEQLYLWEAPFV